MARYADQVPGSSGVRRRAGGTARNRSGTRSASRSTADGCYWAKRPPVRSQGVGASLAGARRPSPPFPASRLADAEIVRALFVPEVSGKPRDVLKALGSLVLTARDLLAGSAKTANPAAAKRPGTLLGRYHDPTATARLIFITKDHDAHESI